jgi:hypothetical protein
MKKDKTNFGIVLHNPQMAFFWLNYEVNNPNIKLIELCKATFNNYVISGINILVYFKFCHQQYLQQFSHSIISIKIW